MEVIITPIFQHVRKHEHDTVARLTTRMENAGINYYKQVRALGLDQNFRTPSIVKALK